MYYASAATDQTGAVTYASGDTSSGSYTNLATTKATSSFGNGTLTIDVPLVGSPKKGALSYPFAISQIKVGGGVSLAFTADTASRPTTGPSTSVGQALKIGRACTKPSRSRT